MDFNAMRLLRKWLALPGQEKRLFLAACCLLVSAKLVCRLLPFRQVWKIAGGADTEAVDTAPRAKIEKIRRAIDRASARVHGSTCLTRALAGALMLRFYGLPHRMAIGVRKPGGGEFSAHAWLLSGGEIVTGELPDLASFTPLPLGATPPPGI
jgi:hypothetical protein